MRVIKKVKALFKRGKAATKVESKPAVEEKTTEVKGQEGPTA
jgi:hypothetical protein